MSSCALSERSISFTTAGVRPLPPTDTTGGSSPLQRGVGAHRAHVTGGNWHRPVACDDGSCNLTCAGGATCNLSCSGDDCNTTCATGRVSAPLVMRWVALKDKAAFARQLDAQAALPGLRRVLVGHGAPITDDPAGTLRQVAAQLRR